MLLELHVFLLYKNKDGFFHGEFKCTMKNKTYFESLLHLPHMEPSESSYVMHHFLPILRDAKVYDIAMSICISPVPFLAI